MGVDGEYVQTLYPWEKDRVPIAQEAGEWAKGAV